MLSALLIIVLFLLADCWVVIISALLALMVLKVESTLED